MLLGIERVRQLSADALLQVVVVRLVELRRLNFPLRLADFVAQLVDGLADLLDLGVPELDRVEHGLFFYFLRARLDHHDAVGRPDHHDVDQAAAHLVVGGIHDELPIHQSHAHRADRPQERNVGECQRARRAVDAEHVGIVIAVGRQHERNDLGLALESLGKHGTHRPVNLPAGEHFALAHAAFALDEASGETSAGVGVFAVINGEREKIDAFARIRVGGGGGEDNVFAESYYGGAAGLLGKLSSFK